MERPKFFTRSKPTTATEAAQSQKTTQSSVSVAKSLRSIAFVGIFLIVVGYIGFSLYGVLKHTANSWSEIMFAYNKPALVKTVRVQYEKRTAALDNEFLTGKPADQKLIDAVKQAVQQKQEEVAQPKQTYNVFR
jgi:LysM repeat protein